MEQNLPRNMSERAQSGASGERFDYSAIERVAPLDVARTVKRVLLITAAVNGGINLLMLAPTLFMYQVYDRVLPTQHVATLVALASIVLMALVLMALLDGARSAVGLRLGVWIERTLSGPLLNATVHGAPLLASMRGAQALRDLATVRGVMGGALWPLLDAPWTPFFFAIAFLIHPLLGWVGIAGGAALLGLAIANEIMTRRAVQRGGAAGINTVNDADNAVRNADALLGMGMLPSWLAAWQEKREAAARPQNEAGFRSGILGAVAKSLRQMLQVALLGFGAWLVIQHEITSGAMIATSMIVARALAPFEMAIASWRSLASAQAAWWRIAALLHQAPQASRAMRLPRPRGDLAVDKVTYMPPSQREPVLRQVSFAAKGGDMVAVIGPSGAGKTTLARLIVGSLVPGAGSIRLDGGAIAGWSPLDRARYVGYLPQDVELFTGSVRENIARFTQAADEEVVAAASAAGAHETILGLPHGYDTQVGPNGVALSGGQRQRIGLARALFGDPRLVVLDEPNSNLDAAGELALTAALKRLKQDNVTVICVAQRVELIIQADYILRLYQGQVDLFGTKDEVMARAIRAAKPSEEPRAPFAARLAPQAVTPGAAQ
jgi:PrtD family type I secretion system ABC transporter